MSREKPFAFEIKVNDSTDKVRLRASLTKSSTKNATDSFPANSPNAQTARNKSQSAELSDQKSPLSTSLSEEVYDRLLGIDFKPQPIYETPMKESTESKPNLPVRCKSSLNYTLDLDHEAEKLMSLSNRQSITPILHKPCKDFVSLNKKILANKRYSSEVDLSALLKQVSKKPVNTVPSRFYDSSEKTADKKANLKQLIENKESAQCTFRPKVQTTNKPPRNFDEVLNQIGIRVARRDVKLERLKESVLKSKSEAEVCSFKPTINPKSLALAKSRTRSTLATTRNLKAETDRLARTPEPTFKPILNKRSTMMKRTGSIETLLYEDAKRRAVQKATAELQTPTKTIPASSMSYQILSRKLLDEFEETFTRLDCDKFELLSWPKFRSLMKSMRFVDLEGVGNRDEELLTQAWKLIGDSRTKSVGRSEMRSFLLDVMNYRTSIPKTESMSQTPDLSSTSTDRSLAIHRDFMRLYENRNKLVVYSTHPNSPQVVECSFQPELLKSSKKAIKKTVAKRGLVIPAGVKYSEYLHNQLQEMSQRAKELAAKAESEMLKTCTFTPKVNAPKTATLAELKSDCQGNEYLAMQGGSRTDLLYKLAEKSQEMQAAKIKKLEDANLKKYQAECTFQPNLSKDAVESKPSLIKGCQEVIERLKRGRFEQNKKKAALTRGEMSTSIERPMKFEVTREVLPQTPTRRYVESLRCNKSLTSKLKALIKKPLQSVPEPIQELEPLVKLTVSLSPDHVEELLIYPGDDIEERLSEFGEKHKLDASKQHKLLETLSLHLSQFEAVEEVEE